LHASLKRIGAEESFQNTFSSFSKASMSLLLQAILAVLFYPS
jgi:hypothetical protein